MSYVAKLIIPRLIDRTLKIYVYRSQNADDINTISKVSQLTPIIIIDQQTASVATYQGKDVFVVLDKNDNNPGITYNGPQPVVIPTTEYESSIKIVNLNPYTFVNELVLSPLPLNYNNGIVYYYSVIAVDITNNQMTHLSKVNGVLINYTKIQDLKREIWYCDDFNDDDTTDVWNRLAAVDYDENTEDISIGDINKESTIQTLGIPVVNTVPKIDESDVHISSHSLISNTFMNLEIKNPWQNNNQEFNYRKLKSYKIRYISNTAYGNFSIPTYQSTLPVSIEKMVILMQVNPANIHTSVDVNNSNVERFEIVRRNGIYYNQIEHKYLGCNRWTIPLESNKVNVFSEFSIQPTINIQISGSVGNVYVFDIYLIDTYQNVSEPTHYVYEA